MGVVLLFLLLTMNTSHFFYYFCCWFSACKYLLGSIVLVFRELNKRLAPKILISLCSSLLALLVVFLVGIERTKNSLVCHTVAALLHYFMLTTFIWMAVEAVNLYRMLVTVFRKGSRSRFFTAASAVAWGKHQFSNYNLVIKSIWRNTDENVRYFL